MTPRFRLTWLALCLACCLAPMSAAEPAGERVGSARVPRQLDDAEVRLVISETFLARRWSVDETSDAVVGRLVHRGYDATVTAIHRDGQVELYCDAWRINKRGERLRRELPRRWIDNLLKDLPIRLTRAALRRS